MMTTTNTTIEGGGERGETIRLANNTINHMIEQLKKYKIPIGAIVGVYMIKKLFTMNQTTTKSRREEKMEALLAKAAKAEEKAESQKRVKKYAGIRNQGATCYLNSIIQMMYHLKNLRAAIYEAESSLGTPLQTLQSLFYEMQQQRTEAVTTKNLIKSFGWTDEEAFIQHDVQELFQVLRNHLEEALEDTNGEGALNIFRGYEQTIITSRRLSQPQASTKTPFFEISLPIKNTRNVEEAITAYIAPSRLNDYSIKGTKGTAERATRIVELPKVLMLHLLRYEYRGGYKMKIQQTFEYKKKLDLNPYVAGEEGTETNKKYQYELYAVLVHKGSSADSGHYYCYIQAEEEKWYKFNDHIVKKANEEELTTALYTNIETAPYVLVYIRQDAIKEALKPIKKVPQHIERQNQKSCAIM